jgi:hemerythrin-like domain-containing protein
MKSSEALGSPVLIALAQRTNPSLVLHFEHHHIFGRKKPMKATDILIEEHRVIERVLTTLETGATLLEAGQPVRPEFFLQAADFVKGFADGCHHQKEEGVLFKAMVENGIPVEGGPIGVMLSEHEMGRAYTRAMRAAAERFQAGDESARLDIVQNARNYTALLRQHIYKEDNVLFPMADRVLPPSQQENVWQGFETVEHEETGEGVHEKYLALAEALEEEIRSYSLV